MNEVTKEWFSRIESQDAELYFRTNSIIGTILIDKSRLQTAFRSMNFGLNEAL